MGKEVVLKVIRKEKSKRTWNYLFVFFLWRGGSLVGEDEFKCRYETYELLEVKQT